MSTALEQDVYEDPWGDEPANPFPGLRSFEPDEDHLFFGREKQIDELLQRLRRTRFLSVVGTSGSGKSSLIRSGLVPSLYSGYMVQAGSAWRTAIFRPGDDPIGYLATALAAPEVLAPADADDDLVAMNRELIDATLRRGAAGLVEATRQARLPAGENLLVIADQFEELFRFKTNRQQRHNEEDSLAFVKLLLTAAAQVEVPIYVVITMRSDFIGNCTEFPGLAEVINEGQYLVPRMTRDECREAIEGPVAVGGAGIAPRLVTRLLNDVGDDPDQLPILQHALMRTWHEWEESQTDGEPLDLHHYEAVGTMSEALSQHAEEAFQELDEAQRELAELLFKALTDKGTESRGVRNPRRVAELAELAGASREEVIAVVEVFRQPGRTFLMPPHPVPLDAESIIDISHESLMRVWDRLIHWVDEEARSAQTYLKLAAAAASFQEGKGGLWRDPELQMALNWQREARPTALWARRYEPAFERAMLFLEASREEHEQRIQARERRRRRQLVVARRIAIGAGLGFLLMVVLGLGVLQQKMAADEQKRIAEDERATALLQKIEADQQREAADQERQRAELLRVEAEQEREAQRRRREALDAQANAERQKRLAEEQKELAEIAEEQARREKQRAEEQEAQARTAEAEARRLGLLSTARALAEQCLRLQKQDPELAALLAVEAWHLHRENGGARRDPSIYRALLRTWTELDPDALRLDGLHTDAVRALAVERNVLLSGGDDGRVVRAELDGTGLDASGSTVAELAVLGSEVRALALDTEARHVVAGTLDGALHLWNGFPETGSPASGLRPKAHPGGVYALDFGKEGTLFSGGADGAVKRWRISAAGSLEPDAVLLDKGRHRVYALDAAPDGTALVAALGDEVRHWDLRQIEAEARALATGQEVRALALAPDGRHLAAGTHDGNLLVWRLGEPAAPPRQLVGHTAQIETVSWNAADLLATASLDASVRLWRVEDSASAAVSLEPLVLDDHDGWVWVAALGPGGEWVASGGHDATVRLRPTRPRSLAVAICRRLPAGLDRQQWTEYLPADLPYRPTCPKSIVESP